MDKRLLIGLLLLPTLAFGADGDGRYVFTAGPGLLDKVLVDSKTGRSWEIGYSKSGNKIYVPVYFRCGEKTFSVIPSCTNLVEFESPEKKSTIEYLDEPKK